MKKLLVLCFCALMALSSCDVQTTVNNEGIPSDFLWIEFWNGGGCIGRYTNVHMDIKIVSTSKVFGESVYFYKYIVTNQELGLRETIIDSEALALKYKEVQKY